MKANQSSKSDKSRRRCVLALMLLTGVGIATFTTLGVTNEFNELFNYSAKELLQTGLSAVALGVLIGFFIRMVNSNISNELKMS